MKETRPAEGGPWAPSITMIRASEHKDYEMLADPDWTGGFYYWKTDRWKWCSGINEWSAILHKARGTRVCPQCNGEGIIKDAQEVQ